MTVLSSMRVLMATAIAVALAALAGGAEARQVSIYRGKCGRIVLPSGATGLGAGIRVDTSCGTFLVDAHGVRFVRLRQRGFKYDGLVGGRRGWLNFYERGRVRWRSRLRHQWGAGVWDGHSLAFLSSRGRLYITDLGRPEQPVGLRFEYPLGWTRSGLLITRRRGRSLVRTRSGLLVRTLRAEKSTFDRLTRTLLFVSPQDELARSDGRLTATIGSLGALWLGRSFEIVPLEEGRVALVGNRLVILGSDGSIVASDRRRGNLPALSSHGAIATIATDPLDDHGRARESVRLLRPGDRSSTLLFVNQVGALGCGHWPSLEWRGDRLLYSTTQGQVVVIDPDSGEHFGLSTVVRRLPGEFLQAHWA
jgi:hypothetical protein